MFVIKVRAKNYLTGGFGTKYVTGPSDVGGFNRALKFTTKEEAEKSVQAVKHNRRTNDQDSYMVLDYYKEAQRRQALI